MRQSKLVIIVITLALGLQPLLWANPAGEGQEATNTERFKEFIREGWNEGKLEMIDQVVAPHCLFYVSGRQLEKVGPEMMKEIIGKNKEDFPGFNLSIEDIFAKDNKVVVRYIFQGTFKKLNKPVILHTAVIAQFSGGKMVKIWIYSNQLDSFLQLGFTLTPPTQEKKETTEKK